MSATPAFVSYPAIGKMAMPEDFPYKDVFLHGRPKHDKYSHFRIRHPEMPCSRRAKLFAPFDALKWFNERIAAKAVIYEPKQPLSDSEKEELNRKLMTLHRLTINKRAAKRNRPVVSITFYSPCTDEENDSYLYAGTYQVITGIVTRIDPVIDQTITVAGKTLPLENIRQIQYPVQ